MEQLQSLGIEFRGEPGRPRDVTAWPAHAVDKAAFDGVGNGGENDRHGVGRAPRCNSGNGTAGGDDHSHLGLHQIGGEGRKPIVLIRGFAIFDFDILAVDVAGLRQPAVKCSSPALVQRAHLSASEKADHRHFLLGTDWQRARQCPDSNDEANKSVTIHRWSHRIRGRRTRISNHAAGSAVFCAKAPADIVSIIIDCIVGA